MAAKYSLKTETLITIGGERINDKNLSLILSSLGLLLEELTENKTNKQKREKNDTS